MGRRRAVNLYYQNGFEMGRKIYIQIDPLAAFWGSVWILFRGFNLAMLGLELMNIGEPLGSGLIIMHELSIIICNGSSILHSHKSWFRKICVNYRLSHE